MKLEKMIEQNNDFIPIDGEENLKATINMTHFKPDTASSEIEKDIIIAELVDCKNQIILKFENEEIMVDDPRFQINIYDSNNNFVKNMIEYKSKTPSTPKMLTCIMNELLMFYHLNNKYNIHKSDLI